MNAKARITYRFDKQHGARLERKPEENEETVSTNVVPFFQEEMKFTSDIGTWNSPFQDDAFALEQLIRGTDRQFGQEGRGKPDGLASADNLNGPHSPDGRAQEQHLHPESNAEADNAHVPADFILLGDEQSDSIRHSNKAEEVHYPIIELDEEEDRGRRTGTLQGAKKRSSFLTATAYRPSRGPSWYKVFASVAGAVATGAVFGYMVLALFAGDGQTGGDNADIKPVTGETTNTSAAGAGDANAGKEGSSGAASAAGSGTKEADSAAALKVSLPSETYYMLQYGVFSTKDGLDAAVNELAGKGLAAAPLTTDRDFRVYIGLAGDRTGAEALSGALPDMEVYVKQIDVPAVEKMVFRGDAKTVETFFKHTNELVRAMDSMTAGKLSGSGGSDEAGWKALHQTWTEEAASVVSGMTREADKTALAKLMQAVNSAAVAAEEYAKKPSDAALWTVQTSLMKAVFAQKDWFGTMDAL